MKKLISVSSLLLTLLMIVICTSCSNDDIPHSKTNAGSLRDCTYSGDYLHVYIDGVLCSSVTEAKVDSDPIYDDQEQVTDTFNSYLIIKGLEKKNKKTVLEVVSDFDTFYGSATINGIDYVVSGEFTGSVYVPYWEYGIIINLYSK